MNFAQQLDIGDRRLEHPFHKDLRQLITAGNLLAIAAESGDSKVTAFALEVWEAAVKHIREVMQ